MKDLIIVTVAVFAFTYFCSNNDDEKPQVAAPKQESKQKEGTKVLSTIPPIDMQDQKLIGTLEAKGVCNKKRNSELPGPILQNGLDSITCPKNVMHKKCTDHIQDGWAIWCQNYGTGCSWQGINKSGPFLQFQGKRLSYKRNYDGKLEYGASHTYSSIDGKLMSEGQFSKGSNHGEYFYWHLDGKLLGYINYSNGTPTGQSFICDSKGKLIYANDYSNFNSGIQSAQRHYKRMMGIITKRIEKAQNTDSQFDARDARKLTSLNRQEEAFIELITVPLANTGNLTY